MQIKELVRVLEAGAPPVYQESYDNSGLIVGNKDAEAAGVLIAVDVTEEVVDEAIDRGCNVIFAHHPLIFKGLKKLNGNNDVERAVIKAIKNDIAIYAAHTNLDKVMGGVNAKLCEKLGLQNCTVLQPEAGLLKKLVVFIPQSHTDQVRNAIFEAGAGHIGEYDKCSYNLEGQGTFRPSEDSNPFSGEIGKLQFEPETRVETVYPIHREQEVLRRMHEAHPYEEVAYDIYPLDNSYDRVGLGMTGDLNEAREVHEFLQDVKAILGVSCIKHTTTANHAFVKRIAVCGGSGSDLIQKAKAAGADVFITADVKYHQFFDAGGDIVIADVGHYESEQVTKEIFYELIHQKFPNFAVYLSNINTNPVNYI